jgi:hypothetical protein
LAIDYQTLQSINNIENDNQLNNLYINPDGGSVYLGSSVSIDNDGIITIENETISTSSDTGALIVKGGIGVAKTSYMASIFPNTTMTS